MKHITHANIENEKSSHFFCENIDRVLSFFSSDHFSIIHQRNWGLRPRSSPIKRVIIENPPARHSASHSNRWQNACRELSFTNTSVNNLFIISFDNAVADMHHANTRQNCLSSSFPRFTLISFILFTDYGIGLSLSDNDSCIQIDSKQIAKHVEKNWCTRSDTFNYLLSFRR